MEGFDEKLDAVMTVLADGLWHKGSDISAACGVRERKIRLMAETTAKLISGNHGYKRVDKASFDEIEHHVASLRSRATKITHRADAIAVWSKG